MRKVLRARNLVGLGVDIQFDERRRLRNALVALAGLDVGWMDWVDRNVFGVHSMRQARIIVERRARCLCSRGYRSWGWDIAKRIIYSDYYFSDSGELRMYL